MDKVQNFGQSQIKNKKIAELDLRAGDTVKVHQKIKEGEKSRIQIFEGVVIARKHGKESGATFSVRKMSGDIGVEKTFPLHAPFIEKIEVLKRAKVRRAKLYYLRSLKGKKAKLKQTQFEGIIAEEEKAPVVQEKEAEEAIAESEKVEEPKAEAVKEEKKEEPKKEEVKKEAK